ncbi:uncharacterized protein PHALS_05704 [Plasmopara halstedii]|uniref:Uncharacterized protein n=1 Tax=Plasmopara halstedii TaxID=4781 RepID=A0A0N7L7W8_PLAHL|nr:uncharacterized protein PHALS_05704 [Plasmopara halstedii]CEG48235.1 hypothetical protein PHALS_05704 [Plasmopara halstedii]|eukprot:XP_024584604.1 hypothetical protein PHALS_05704 [Plasmopara halstedii]
MIRSGVEGSIKLTGKTSNASAILNLYYLTNVQKYLEALVGADQVMPPRKAQIALRFPELGEPQHQAWITLTASKVALMPMVNFAGTMTSATNLTAYREMVLYRTWVHLYSS